MWIPVHKRVNYSKNQVRVNYAGAGTTHFLLLSD
jgi:hypothetical protein